MFSTLCESLVWNGLFIRKILSAIYMTNFYFLLLYIYPALTSNAPQIIASVETSVPDDKLGNVITSIKIIRLPINVYNSSHFISAPLNKPHAQYNLTAYGILSTLEWRAVLMQDLKFTYIILMQT